MDLFTEIVLSDVTPLPRMSRTGSGIGHVAWHEESPDRRTCGSDCDWQREYQRLREQTRGTKRFREELEARVYRG
jgi:hypothetical protein